MSSTIVVHGVHSCHGLRCRVETMRNEYGSAYGDLITLDPQGDTMIEACDGEGCDICRVGFDVWSQQVIVRDCSTTRE